MLHDDGGLFRQAVLFASEVLGIESGIVEKDYYVTMFLRALSAKLPTLVFKGGTSLSKCYKLIQRFSEDIDLNLEGEKRPSEGQRRHLKESIVSTIEEFGFALRDPDRVMSRRDYNRYVIDFPSAFDFAALKPVLIVETSVFLRAYPSRKMEAASLVYDCLKREGRSDLIERYALEPFALNVQAVERTFLDKLFALGDYCLAGKVMEHSRHLYDLYKLSAVVAIDEPLKALFNAVRKERSAHPACLSAQEGVDLKALLQTIVREDVYRSDYEAVTAKLLFEYVPYEAAASALQKVVDSGLLDA